MSWATLVEIISTPTASDSLGWRSKILVSQLLSFSRLLEQSQLFFQWQLDPGFPYNNPDTIDSRLKLNFATGPNIVQIGNRFWERHLKLAGHPTHDPYCRKESFLVKIESSFFYA